MSMLGDSVGSTPAIDMYQTDNEVVVKASIPGIKAEDVQINVTGDITSDGGVTELTPMSG